MKPSMKNIIGLALAAIVIAVLVVVVIKRKSGEVEVQTPEGKKCLKAGEETIVEGSGKPTKLDKKSIQKVRLDTSAFLVSGQVEDDEGKLVVGAMLKLYEAKKPDDVILKINSDDGGAFIIDNLKPGNKYTIAAEDTYCFPSKVENIDTAADDLVIVLERGAVISGKVVTKDGQPIANALIRAIRYIGNSDEEKWRLRSKSCQASSDTSGAFEMKCLKKEGAYDFYAAAEGFAGTEVKVIPAGSQDVVIRLPRETTIFGKVFNYETGEPLEKVTIRLKFRWPKFHIKDKSIERTPAFEVGSNADGFYIFHDVPVGYEGLVLASDTGFVSDPVLLKLEEEENRELDLPLYSPLTLEGQAVLKNVGTPIAGVKLNLSGSDFNVTETSDTDGLFAFKGLRGGKYGMRIMKPCGYFMGYADLKGREKRLRITLEKDRKPEPLFVEVEHSRRIVGKITDEDGEALVGVSIKPVHPEGKTDIYKYFWLRVEINNIDGSYELSKIPSEVTKMKLKFHAPQYTPLEILVEFPAHEIEKVLDVVFEKEKQGLTISGYVVDSDSKPISIVSIHAYPAAQGREYLKGALSDPQGHYCISGVTSGLWNIEARKEKYAPLFINDLEVKEDSLTDFNITMTRGEKIAGRILISNDKPLSLNEVRFSLKSDPFYFPHRNVDTDKNGKFIIDNMPPGKYDIKFKAYYFYEYTPKKRHLKLEREIKNVATGTEDIIINFNYGSVSGTVKDAVYGNPVADFTVNVRCWDKEGAHYERHSEYSFAAVEDGAFTLDLLPPGKCWLEVTAKGYISKKVEDIIIKENESTEDLIITLDRGSIIKGRIVRAHTFEPIENSKLALRGEQSDGKRFSDWLETNHTGKFLFGSVPTGEDYSLRIEHANYPLKVVKKITAYSGHETDLHDIILDIGAAIEGTVTDHNGKPLNGAGVRVQAIIERDGL